MTITARSAAYRVLSAVLSQRKSMDQAFAAVRAFDTLAPRDRAFARVLVATALKREGEMRLVLEGMLEQPLSELRPSQLLYVFYIGIVQLVFLKTPEHAAVDTTVELAMTEKMHSGKGLVNAVMRRLVREGYPEVDNAACNTPAWMWHEWVKDYGTDTAADIAWANMNEAPVDFTVRSDAEGWAQKLEATLLPTGSIRRENAGIVPELAGFDEGAWWVQNAASALPVLAFSDMCGKTVVDLCAAPGGKTAQLANAGAIVSAVEKSPSRMKRLAENMKRLKMDITMFPSDATTWRPKAKLDAVLLDAPCTATGTIRHQPDVLHIKNTDDQEKMVELQRRLLLNAATMLKDGGELIYATCSIQKAEGEHQTDWFLAQNLGFTLEPIRIAGIDEMLTPRGEIRALPCHWRDIGGIDGFYTAKFRKV